MANVDFTLEEVRTVVREEIKPVQNELGTVKREIRSLNGRVDELTDRVDAVRTMLDEDVRAESERVGLLEKRLTRTRVELRKHIADSSAHSD